jgi:hypothetical protein
MKKYLVYGEKANGDVMRFECFANSKAEAEEKQLRIWADYGVVKATAFDWNIQFRA